MVGQKFKIKATLDGQQTKSLEFNRGTKLALDQVKNALERLFAVGTLGMRYRFADGRVQPIYQDFHLHDAVKDCEKVGNKYITILVHREGGSGSSTYASSSSTSRTQVATQQAPVQTRQAPAPAQSSVSSGAKKFCEECGSVLPNNVKFCPECGHSHNDSQPSVSQQSVSHQQSSQQPKSSASGEQVCSGCGNALSGTAIRALEKHWHKECFACVSCHKSLATGGFLEDSNGNPICSNCFDTRFSKRCNKCGRNIDGAYLSVDGHEYHKTCFICTNCNSTFDGGYYMKDGKPFCKNCV